jgi:hypothetical protein
MTTKVAVRRQMVEVVLEANVLENFSFSIINMKDEAADSSKSVVTIY